MAKEQESKMTEKQRENKKEDKKAFGKFAVILTVAFIMGIVIGVGSVILADVMMEKSSVKEMLLSLLRGVAIYGGYVVTTILLLPCVILHIKCRQEFDAWDEEDEDVLADIEIKQSYVMWFSNLILYGTYLFLSLGVWAMGIGNTGYSPEYDTNSYLIALGAVFLHMVYGLIAACIIQQKAVNLSKEINPEKIGSVYDVKFQDKWLANCDEAERFTVYKCSFKTFKTMQITGLILWIICLISQMTFGTGAFATIMVTIYLLIQTSVYSVQGIYFAKHPSEVMK